MKKPLPTSQERISAMIGRTARILTILGAGAALSITAAQPALAINDIRRIIRIDDAITQGFNGDTVAIASVEPGHPLPTHQALNGRIKLQIQWPFDNSGSVGGLVDRGFVFSHATAVTSVMAGDGFEGVSGLVPNATFYTGSFSSGFDPFTGEFADQTPTAISFPLFALTDQPLADAIAARTGVAPYDVATVVNTSFGTGRSETSAAGEDRLSRIYNAVAFMTDATIVASVGNDGLFDPTQGGGVMEDFGNAFGPATAHNTLGVGYLGEDGSARAANDISGHGPVPAIDYVDAAELFPEDEMPMDDDDDGGMEPPSSTIFEARPGVDIMAPGYEIRLAGSQIPNTELSTTAVSDLWIGSSFASAAVASVAAIIHDVGNKQNLWPSGRPSGILTRAILINSADLSPGGETLNSPIAMQGMPPNPLGGQPDDETNAQIFNLPYDGETGAGMVSVPRALEQFIADIPDIRPGDTLFGSRLEGFTFNPVNEMYDIPAFGTDPGTPFVTQMSSLFGRAPSILQNRHYAKKNDRAGARYRIVDDFTVGPIHGRVAQFQNQGNPNVLDPGPAGSPSGGGVPSNPNFPLPGGGGGGGFGGLNVSTGWDVGNIGNGNIDIPLGFLTEGSDFRITLVWNRQENWELPDYSGPLSAVPLDTWVFSATPDALDPDAPDVGFSLDPRDLEQNARPFSIRPLDPGEAAMPTGGVRFVHEVLPDGTTRDDLRPIEPMSTARASRAGAGLEPADVAGGVEARNAFIDLDGAVVAERNLGDRAVGIQLIFTPAAQAFPDLMDAVIEAASVWEAELRDDVSIRIMIDVGGEEGGPVVSANINGFAGENLYPDIRTRMIADATLFERSLLESLPLVMQFSVPQNLDPTPDPDFISTANEQVAVFISSGNVKAIEADSLFGLDPAAMDGSITFNVASGINYDFDPTDGVTPGDYNVVRSSTRLIGQILGFDSGVDLAAGPLGEAGIYFPTPLDFFRFNIVRTSEGMGENMTFDGNPNTRTDFSQFSRSLSVTEMALFDHVGDLPVDMNPNLNDAQDEVRFAQGLVVSGEPADSWIQTPFPLNPIGIFDSGRDLSGANPEIPIFDYVNDPDKAAMELIGWETDVFDDIPTSNVPVVGFPNVGDPELGLAAPSPLFQFAQQNLDLEVWRAADGSGSPPFKVAASRSQWGTVESVVLGDDPEDGFPISPTGAATQGNGLVAGSYFIRIIFEQTSYDFGGFEIPQMLMAPIQSEAIEGFQPFPTAQIEYALAWRVELAITQGSADAEGETEVFGDLDLDGRIGPSDLNVLLSQFGAQGGPADLNADGVVNSSDLATLLGLFTAD